jgi:hypothetical protein
VEGTYDSSPDFALGGVHAVVVGGFGGFGMVPGEVEAHLGAGGGGGGC